MRKLIIGEPVELMKVAESTTSIGRFREVIEQHNGGTFAEIKSDGYRIQVHNNGELAFFTGNLNPLNTEVYPDILGQLKGLPRGIWDGELVGVEGGLRGFNAVKTRKRQSLDADLIRQYPLEIRFFDILNLEGKNLTELPLQERRRILENYAGRVSCQWQIANPYDLEQKFKEVTDELGLEGLVCKNPDSQYLIGARTRDWIKLKKFLTLDLVVLGVYRGKGKAAKLPFAALLLGTANEGNYETLTKVGISNRELISRIEAGLAGGYCSEPPTNVRISDAINKSVYRRKIPSFYICPEKSVVVEIETMNVTRSANWHSCGLEGGRAYSLRISTVKRYREDKKSVNATTTKQVRELYRG